MANVTALNNDIDALRGNLDQFFLVIMGCLIFCEYIILDGIVNFFPLILLIPYVLCERYVKVLKTRISACKLNLIPPSSGGKKPAKIYATTSARIKTYFLRNEKNVCN